MDIDINTRMAAIIGTDIGHSKSPAMMNAAYRELGLNAVYYPMNIREEDFAEVVRGISKMNFMGLTITIPYKIRVMDLMDEIDETARVIGAVNTIKITDGHMKGYNTDGEGFVRGLEKDLGVDVAGSTIAMFGAGGVARAIATVIAFRKAAAGKDCDRKLYIINRTLSRAQELADRLNSQVCDCCVAIQAGSPEADEAVKAADVVANATNIGMAPQEGMTPFDTDLLRSDQIAADVIYNPLKTRFLEDAEAKGCRWVNGQSLLIHQGLMAFNIWTGLDAPADAMFKAVFG